MDGSWMYMSSRWLTNFARIFIMIELLLIQMELNIWFHDRTGFVSFIMHCESGQQTDSYHGSKHAQGGVQRWRTITWRNLNIFSRANLLSSLISTSYMCLAKCDHISFNPSYCEPTFVETTVYTSLEVHQHSERTPCSKIHMKHMMRLFHMDPHTSADYSKESKNRAGMQKAAVRNDAVERLQKGAPAISCRGTSTLRYMATPIFYTLRSEAANVHRKSGWCSNHAGLQNTLWWGCTQDGPQLNSTLIVAQKWLIHIS